MSPTRDRWGSQLGFILASIGFAVGLGNIWRFPYLTGQNGGGAFLLIYLGLAIVIGIPLFTAEISLGRKAQKSPAAGMRALAGDRSPWRIIGWLGIGAALLIMAYYQIVMGWIVAHLMRALGRGYTETDATALAAQFDGLTGRPGVVLAYTAGVLVLMGLIVSRGLREGLERAAKALIPVLFLFLIGLAIVGVGFEGAGAGLTWLFKPDFAAVTAGTWLAALGQVFYSIGVGMAGAFVFGSYLDPEKSDVPGNATKIVAFDTVAAVLAGVVIFPALFAFGIEPDTGPGLLFVTMSGLFGRLPIGDFAAGLFFFLVFIAGLTSCLALIETLTGTFMDTFGWARRKSLWSVLGILFSGGILIALGYGPLAHLQIAGRGLFDLADFISGNVFLTVGGFAIALYVGFGWGFERFREETNRGAGAIRVTAAWRPVMRFIAPVAVGLVVLMGLGLLS
jgi:NSS family neurotransmitter:Na+ symporter